MLDKLQEKMNTMAEYVGYFKKKTEKQTLEMQNNNYVL